MSTAPSRRDRIAVRIVAAEEMPALGPRLAALERDISYPLGTDRFRIDHGPDYFAFFRRLGALRYAVATRDDEILAVLAAVLRPLPRALGGPAWYAGDLKVAPAGRGLGLPRRLVELVRGHGPRRGYGISMDPGDGAPNPVVRLVQRLWPDVRAAARLRFWALRGPAMQACTPVVRAHRGDLAFLSLAGLKDLVLASTGAPMPLLHVQFGSCAAGGLAAPHPDSVHMLCAPFGDALDHDLVARGHAPMATATVVEVGMDDVDWSFVLTSEV